MPPSPYRGQPGRGRGQLGAGTREDVERCGSRRGARDAPIACAKDDHAHGDHPGRKDEDEELDIGDGEEEDKPAEVAGEDEPPGQVRGGTHGKQVPERADHDRDLLVQARAELAEDEAVAAQEASPEPGQRP